MNFGVRPIGGGPIVATVSFQNTSTSSVAVDSLAMESGSPAPFSIRNVPHPLPNLAPQATLTVPVVFSPPRTSGDFVQNFADHLVVTTSAGKATVPLEGSAAPDPQISISSLSLNVGTVALGQSGTVSFTVGNAGGTPLTITQSKPPITRLFHGPHFARGGHDHPGPRDEDRGTVRFSPTRAGPTASATWLITGNDYWEPPTSPLPTAVAGRSHPLHPFRLAGP